MNVTERWRSYSDITKPQITDNYGLGDPHARQTPHGDMAIAIYECSPWSRGPTNLLVVRADGNHRYQHSIKHGQYAQCNGGSIDPTVIVVCESYLSGLAVGARYDEDQVYVLACFAPDNILPVINSISTKWPYIDYIAAPDPTTQLPNDICTIHPPGNLTWVELHQWESNQCAAA